MIIELLTGWQSPQARPDEIHHNSALLFCRPLGTLGVLQIRSPDLRRDSDGRRGNRDSSRSGWEGLVPESPLACGLPVIGLAGRLGASMWSQFGQVFEQTFAFLAFRFRGRPTILRVQQILELRSAKQPWSLELSLRVFAAPSVGGPRLDPSLHLMIAWPHLLSFSS